MNPQKHRAAWIAVILASSCWTAQAAQRYPYPNREGFCPKGVDCYPKRATYGFTPTRWRPWPTTEKPAAAQSELENLPTPAKEVEKGEPEAPRSPAEGAPRLPMETEQEPATPETRGESPPASPFDDSPPGLPKEPAGQEKLPFEPSRPGGGLPSAPPQISLPAPEDADEPPAMRDDDPFKDDPPAEKDAFAPSTSARGATKPNRAGNSRQAGQRWRAGNKGPLTRAESLPMHQAAVLDEPGLLPFDADRQGAGGALPINTPGVRNPLRSEAAKPPENKVVPAAGGPTDQAADSPEPGLLRVEADRQGAGSVPINPPGVRNPLRSQTANLRENSIVPAAAWAVEQVEPSDLAGGWRRNPLRPN